MKVACLLGSLNRGGTETLVLDVFQNRKNANYEMIAIYRKDGQLSTEFKKTQIPFFKLSPASIFDVGYFFRLRKLLKSQQVQLVHAQQPIDAIYASICCVFSGIKIALTFHGFPSSDFLTKLINLFAIKCSDSIIFVSEFQKQFYQKKYKLKKIAKLHVIYNGISLAKLENYAHHSIRKEFNIPENALLMGSVGNFVAVRDQMTICRFLHLLKKQGIAFHFLFAGKKNDSEAWRYDNCVDYCRENNLSEQVLFIGSRPDVPNILNQLDAFIYASNHDTFGIAVIEAIISKVPVFVNDWEVMKEITKNGEIATIYETKNENDLFSKFMLFLQDKGRYTDEAEKASLSIGKQFNIEKHMSELEKFYTDLLIS